MELLQKNLWGYSDLRQWRNGPVHQSEDHVAEDLDIKFISECLFQEFRGNPENVAMDQPVDASFLDAIASLDDIESDAHEMGYPIPEGKVVSEARRILIEMHNYRGVSYDAYSMSEGRVGIGVDGGFGKSMLVVCEPGGTALCVVTVDRVSRHARYGASSFLPDDFVKQGLRQLSPDPLSVGRGITVQIDEPG